jgi:mercuric ion transport protein
MLGALRASLVSSFAALGVATCCVMPKTMMLLGLAGDWIVIFGQIAAASTYVLAGSTVLILLAWILAVHRHAFARLKVWLKLSTGLTALAWGIFLNETQINDLSHHPDVTP